MNVSRFFAALSLLLALAPSLTAQAATTRLEEQVMRVFVTKREIDRTAPWQNEDVIQQAFLAAVLPNGELLTTAYAVADAAFLELQRFGSSQRHEARVKFVDYEANMALLEPVDPKALTGTKAVAFGDDLALDERVEVYKVRDAYQLSHVAGSLQDVGIVSSGTSAYGIVSYAIKIQQTGLGWAEPVVQSGKLVALTTGQDQNFLQAIPMSVIKHFLKDRHDSGYRGFPGLNVQLASLVSPDTRRLLGAPGTDSGVRIAEVQEGGAFSGKLLPDDILTEVDGVAVSEHGYISHPLWGKVHLKLLLNQRYGGDMMRLKILRQGKELAVEAPLTRFDSNRTPVVAYRYDKPEPHVIVGGLVFQELSQDFLRQWGKDWRETAPLELLYVLNERNKPEADATRRIIFLTRVLADPFNRGYNEMRNKLIDAVNGRKITSMEDLRAALAAPAQRQGKSYLRIKFAPEGDEVVLGVDGLAAANARIASTYEINTPSSFFTP